MTLEEAAPCYTTAQGIQHTTAQVVQPTIPHIEYRPERDDVNDVLHRGHAPVTKDELRAALESLIPAPTLESVEHEYTKEQMLAYAIDVLDVALRLRKS